MLKICLIGVGKTGKEIAKTILNQKNMILISALCSPGSSKEDRDLGEIMGTQEIGIRIRGIDRLKETLLSNKPDVVIDFSDPGATLKNAEIISIMKINMVIGTTGFSETDLEKLKAFSYDNQTGIVYAPNITPGVNVMMILTKLASILLNNYDFQVSEIHHKNKKDIPSGTALKIVNEIKEGLSYSGNDTYFKKIPVNSVRVGGVVGKHEVLIAGEDDRIIISHESFSRKAFADGAILAINFIQNKIGYYEMNDVLRLSEVIEDLFVNQGNESYGNLKEFHQQIF